MNETELLVRRRKLDADAFFRMGEVGIFAKEDRVELIDGELIEMAPIGQDHDSFVAWLTEFLILAFMRQATVFPQNSLRIDRRNAPQPDVTVLRRRSDFYRAGERAGPEDVLLLIELSDSSLRYDRTVKLPLYARAGIPEVWILDVGRLVLESHRAPSGDSYTSMTEYHRGDTVALAMAPQVQITLQDVFG